MGWNYKDEKKEPTTDMSGIKASTEHLRELQELAGIGSESLGSNYEDDYEDEEYETYVKYIVSYRSTRLERDFEDLEAKVNKFIEEQDDSFILEGPIKVVDNYLVQTLINEDEM